MAPYPASVAAYGKPGGGAWAAGDTIGARPTSARTLRAIATDGPDVVLQGLDRRPHRRRHGGKRRPHHEGRPGRLQGQGAESRSRYVSRLRDHLDASAEHRRRRVDRDAQHPGAAGSEARKACSTAPALHAQIEAMRRAYLDRARYLGDPDFVDVPVARLTSKPHATRRRRRRSTPTRPPAASSSARDLLAATTTAVEPEETTHFSVVDRDGMAVADHLHARRRLRLSRRRQGRRLPPEQRDGRLQQEAGRDQPHGRHRHRSQPDRARQAHAQLDDAHHRGSKRQGRADHGIARRADDHEHGADDRRSASIEYGLNGRQAVDLARIHHQWLPDYVAIEKSRGQRLCRRRVAGDGTRGPTARAARETPTSIWVSAEGMPYGVNDKRSTDSKASKPAFAR